MNVSFKSSDLPSLKWVLEDMERKHLYTPDKETVLAKSKWYLFLPDDLKFRHRRHDLIQGNSELKVHAAYTEKDFFHWKKDLGDASFTIPLQCTPKEKQGHLGPMPAKVCGELHLVDSHLLLYLDQHRLNGVQFERKRIKLRIPYREQRWLKDRGRAEEVLGRNLDASTAYLTKWQYAEEWAWMYCGIRDYWDEQLDAGYQFQPVPVYKPNTNWINAYSLYKDIK